MSLKDFLAQSQASAPKQFDRTQQGDGSTKVNYIHMGYPGNQGIIRFIPIMSVKDQIISYLYDTGEFQVKSVNDNDEEQWRWAKVLQPKDYTSKLTQDQLDKVGKAHSLLTSLQELGYDTDWVRYKNYAVFLGYVISHINTDGEVLVNSENRTPAIIVCTSKNVAKAMQGMLESMASSSAGEELMSALYNRNTTNRQFFLELGIKPGSGFGYDVTLNYKGFDLLTRDLLTKDEQTQNGVNIPEDIMELMTSPSAIFVGNRNSDGEDFVESYIDEVIKQAQSEIDKTSALNRKVNDLPPLPEDNNAPQSNGWE